MKKVPAQSAAADSSTEEIFSLLFEVGRVMRQACTAASDTPFSLAHIEAIRFVHEGGNPTMRDLAEHLRVTAPSASALVDDLVAKKHLIRREDLADRRLVRISLSAEGKEFLVKVLKLRRRALQGLLTRLSAKDKREFARILSILVKK